MGFTLIYTFSPHIQGSHPTFSVETKKYKMMKNALIKILIALSLTACLQSNQITPHKEEEANQDEIKTTQSEPHRYGDWYCPDNLNGFPAVDIADWKNVKVVNGRMPTIEETSSGTSLIFVDMEKYPKAKPLDLQMPQLATFYNHSSRRKEFVIIIQALNIFNDSIVGFRYLNGGNGSSRLNEVTILTEKEIEKIPKSSFVSLSINIKATQDEIWKIMKSLDYSKKLQPIFDKNNKLPKDWRMETNVNFHYSNAKTSSASYADKLYGNFYIQNDYEELNYTQKFFLSDNEKAKTTELKIVCGPYTDVDFKSQKLVLKNWGNAVKELSEAL